MAEALLYTVQVLTALQLTSYAQIALIMGYSGLQVGLRL